MLRFAHKTTKARIHLLTMKKVIVLTLGFLAIFYIIETGGGKIGKVTTVKTDLELVESCKNGNILDCSTAARIAQGSLKSDNSTKIDIYDISMDMSKALSGVRSPLDLIKDNNNLNQMTHASSYVGNTIHKNNNSKNLDEVSERKQPISNTSEDDSNAILFSDEELTNGNLTKVEKDYRKSCNLGNHKACSKLGLIYYKGINVPQNIMLAIYYYQKSCNKETNTFLTCTKLGVLHENEKDIIENYEKAIEFYTLGCNKENNNSACTKLGNLYRTGKGAAVNYEKALTLFSRSCHNKDSTACMLLGYMYENQLGTYSVDYQTKAIKFYNKACKYNSKWACKRYKQLTN